VKGSSNFKRPIHVHICTVPRLNASCACGERTSENLMEGVYAACRQPKIWRVCFSYALKTASIEACANQVSQRDQHILQADAPVEIIEQFRKNAIEPNRLILRLPALRAEQMIDVVVLVQLMARISGTPAGLLPRFSPSMAALIKSSSRSPNGVHIIAS
jgi:hypothetical protein